MNKLTSCLLTSIKVSLLSMSMLAVAAGQQVENEQDILLGVLLGAYNGGAQAYANKTGAKAHLLSETDLAELNDNIAQLQELVTDENGQIDIDKVNALLRLASQSDYEFMGLSASSLEEPLQVLEKAAAQGKTWQQALLELKAQNQPIIERTLEKISPNDDGQSGQAIADVLSVLVGAGMAIEEISKDESQHIKHKQTLDQEINHLKGLAEKDMPILLHTDTNHQFDALIGRLKIAYADNSIGEQSSANTQSNIQAIKYFIENTEGRLSESQYNDLLLWLNRLDDSYNDIRQQVVNQHDNLIEKTK